MATERILVVDDEAPIREILCAMLQGAGYLCRSARSGLDALRLLREDAGFDLILSDLMMPEMDGIALLDNLRESAPDIPVLMVTAVHDVSVALAAIRKGAYDYLLKPFEREQLLAMVRRALDHRRLRIENHAYQQTLEQLVSARTDQLRKALGDLERSYDVTLEALGDALDLKDAETEGHSKRVTAYTLALARAMKVGPEQIRTIARGAYLHDIGKMAIPDAILRKPGALTEEERSIMREHCYRGYQILRKIPFLSEAAEIVYTHQERYDGLGYPRGLSGQAIPIGARLFAVADTLDAITSDRPYRPAQTFAAARREIRQYAGTQFDPEVVDLFLSIPDAVWENLRQEVMSHSRRVLSLI